MLLGVAQSGISCHFAMFSQYFEDQIGSCPAVLGQIRKVFRQQSAAGYSTKQWPNHHREMWSPDMSKLVHGKQIRAKCVQHMCFFLLFFYTESYQSYLIKFILMWQPGKDDSLAHVLAFCLKDWSDVAQMKAVFYKGVVASHLKELLMIN